MKKITAIAVAGFVALATAAPAAAVDAMTLPEGDTMYFVDCDMHPGMVWEIVDETISAAVSISDTIDGADGCAYSGGYDVANNDLYWVDGNVGAIGRHDLETGTSELIEISGDAADIWQLAIDSDGTAIMETNSAPYGFYSIDLETGVTTTIDGDIGPWGFLTYNPMTDEFMHFINGNGVVDVYTVNVEDGTQTLLESLDTDDFPTVDNACENGNQTGSSFDEVVIDSEGKYWIQMDGSYSDMVVYDPATETYSYNGQIHDQNAEFYPADNWCDMAAFYQMGMILAYGGGEDSELADTGADANVVLGLAVAATVALVVGGFAARRRARA